jgi:hypothetical protein
MTSRYFTLHTKKSDFYAILSDDGSISVGGKIKGCVFISPVNNRVAVLERVSYDIRCNINGDMSRSYGTVAMIKAALEFAFFIHPNLKEIHLQDHSHVECGETALMLGPLYITLYGKTWYEQKFGARLLNEYNYTRIMKYIEYVQTKPEWNTLWSLIKSTIQAENRNVVKDKIKEWWGKTGSFREMIKGIKDSHQCDLFVEWLHVYFTYNTGVSIADQRYVIKRYIGDTIEVEPTDITNPYIQSLSLRQSKQKDKYTEVFMSFIPRRAGGTRYTFGKGATFSQLLAEGIL